VHTAHAAPAAALKPGGLHQLHGGFSTAGLSSTTLPFECDSSQLEPQQQQQQMQEQLDPLDTQLAQAARGQGDGAQHTAIVAVAQAGNSADVAAGALNLAAEPSTHFSERLPPHAVSPAFSSAGRADCLAADVQTEGDGTTVVTVSTASPVRVAADIGKAAAAAAAASHEQFEGNINPTAGSVKPATSVTKLNPAAATAAEKAAHRVELTADLSSADQHQDEGLMLAEPAFDADADSFIINFPASSISADNATELYGALADSSGSPVAGGLRPTAASPAGNTGSVHHHGPTEQGNPADTPGPEQLGCGTWLILD